MVDPGQLEFSAIKSKIRWGTYFQNMFRPKFGGGFADYSSGGPTVVAENCNGEKRIVASAKTMEEASQMAGDIAAEFKTLGPLDWCERYHVPQSFIA
jgi:hypothetical protein